MSREMLGRSRAEKLSNSASSVVCDALAELDRQARTANWTV